MIEYQSVRRYLFFNRLPGYFILSILAMLIFSCGKKEEQTAVSSPDWNYTAANAQYKMLQIETELAKSGKVYMVLDFARKKILLKLKGAIVWDYPLTFTETDSLKIGKFIRAFDRNGEEPLRLVKNKYLFRAADKTPDSVLQIVGEVVKVRPELLQREIPERFYIAWNSRLKLIVKTDITGKPTSTIYNTIINIADVLDSPLGEQAIELKMEPSAALTLYYIAEKGLPTLLVN